MLVTLLAAVLSVTSVPVQAIIVSTTSTTTTRGYGRFPCTTDAECSALSLGSCVPDTGPGVRGTFCGIANARCDPTGQQNSCDNGACYSPAPGVGFCVGGFGSNVPQDRPCLGSLGKDENGICGILGSYCGTLNQHGLQSPNDAYDQNCQSNYCNTGTFTCGTRAGLGESCAFDPIRGCQTGLFPNIDVAAGTCVCLSTPQPGASARARARARERRNLASLCPSSHTACSLGGAGAYECIDTSSNLEQCGGCLADGGIDCTSLVGVSAVGCVEGRCEIWRCEDGWRFDAAATTCILDT